MSRTKNAFRNFIWTTVSTMLSSILGFVSRTIFIYILGITYVGISSLFTNVLSLLSLSELGIGSAISFRLYKPLATNNQSQICSLMQFYRKAYRYVSVTVFGIGIIITPFLPYLVKETELQINIYLVFYIYLFNTISSYLISYKSIIITADQNTYLITNINMISSIITLLFQILILGITKNYYCYLITASVITFGKNVFINMYVNKKYSYLKNKKIQPLSKNETREIGIKIKAMMFHKVGQVCIYQTDNILISTIIGVNVVGLVANFTLFIDLANKLIVGFFNSATAGFGNLIATEKDEKKQYTFGCYNFFANWFYFVSAICLYYLLVPLVTLWLGADKLISPLSLFLLTLNFYLAGLRVPLGNIKAASGVFEVDKYSPIIQSVINLVLSIIGAILWGLPGIYIGTLLSSMVPNIWRPIVVYKYILHKNVKDYFITYIAQILSYSFTITILHFILPAGSTIEGILGLILRALICFVTTNVIFFICNFRRKEFRDSLNIIKCFIGPRLLTHNEGKVV